MLFFNLAVFNVRKWMYENDAEILNVAGSRASKDPEIYKKVFDILKGVYWTNRIKKQPPKLRIVK